jgi:hypothetical protein
MPVVAASSSNAWSCYDGRLGHEAGTSLQPHSVIMRHSLHVRTKCKLMLWLCAAEGAYGSVLRSAHDPALQCAAMLTCVMAADVCAENTMRLGAAKASGSSPDSSRVWAVMVFPVPVGPTSNMGCLQRA